MSRGCRTGLIPVRLVVSCCPFIRVWGLLTLIVLGMSLADARPVDPSGGGAYGVRAAIAPRASVRAPLNVDHARTGERGPPAGLPGRAPSRVLFRSPRRSRRRLGADGSGEGAEVGSRSGFAAGDRIISRRRFLGSAALLLAGCADRNSAFESLPTAPQPLRIQAEPPIVGINSHLLSHHDLQFITSLGINHVRSTIISTRWEMSGEYRAWIRNNTARARSYGVSLLYVVHNAIGAPFRLAASESEAWAFTNSVASMLEELPDVEAWQLWNEQNVWTQAPFGAGSTPPRTPKWIGRTYGEWWKKAYERLKNVRPEATLVTGATADDRDGTWEGFLIGFAETGARADAVAVHAYGTAESRRSILTHANHLFRGTPIWLTECGAAPGAYWSPERQLASWVSFIDRTAGMTQRVYPYCLQTDPNDPWYGIWNLDGTERPVVNWLRQRMGGNWSLLG